jgi:2-oxoglutarate dehydrogenase E1 component
MDFWHDFHGPNAGYILELYDRYRADPEAVDAATRAFFADGWTPPAEYAAVPSVESSGSLAEIVGAANVAQAIRSTGHLAAHLDPLGSPPPGDPLLELAAHGIEEATLRRLPAELVGGPIAQQAANAWAAIEELRAIYSSTIGYDYDHILVPAERDWLRDAAESRRFRLEDEPDEWRALLSRLTEVEVFEQFLQRVFPGKHRFSIEGLDVMVPVLDEIICAAADDGIGNVLIGMAHRGRLNVLAHVLQKPYAQILAEFKDPIQKKRSFFDDLGWTGDVKYHKGAYRQARGDEPCDVTIDLPPNPSHLEAINPVLSGMARAAGTRTNHPGPPEFDPALTLPILIHGDAAFPGQGVVTETLTLSGLGGYWVGGTVHIIANNQLGYTATSEESRSTHYASTVAKGYKIPIVHVNADDPAACLEVARLAFGYRARFHKDFMIDLIGYRRYGHNEGDEPSFTQPLMYDIIRSHPTVRARWAERLEAGGVLTPEQADEMVQQHTIRLQNIYENLQPEEDLYETRPKHTPRGMARHVKTAISLERVQALSDALLAVPEGFHLHRKLGRVMDRRRDDLRDPDAPAVDWAWAETLALASVLEDGIPVRLSGQDTQRGTFNQRHAVFHDTETGREFIPLQAFPQAHAACEILNSPLSEGAVVGFEYGYSLEKPGALVIWEAQYGDFVNNAQTMIDEFVSAGRAKWGQTTSLVMLLPHGYEGAGPDHSSARLERFLQLTGETNMRIANCTTAAQFFHLLRRQALLLESDPLPLIVMTPKSLLRHPRVACSLRELSTGSWQPVIDDERAHETPGQIKRVFLCTGKVFVDLVTSDYRDRHPEVAVVRLEQLYPFPEQDLVPVLEHYPNAEEIVWVQEEPANMGAWQFIAPLLEALNQGRWRLRYVGRAVSSSPAEGSSAWYTENQERLIVQAFDPGPDPIDDDFVVS